MTDSGEPVFGRDGPAAILPTSLSPNAQARSRRSETRRFVLLADGRTGSTWLELLLDRHPDVVCEWEMLHGSLIDHSLCFSEKFPAHLDKTVWRKYSGFAAVGFRLLYEQCATPDSDRTSFRPEVFRYFATQALFVVHLVRRNVLNKLLSRKLAQRFQIFGGRPYPPTTLDISPDELRHEIERQARFLQAIAGQLDQQPTIAIYYEDLCANTTRHLDVIFRFLGVRSVPVAVDFPKQRVRPQNEYIANYMELKAAFVDTPHGWMFEV